MYSKSTIHTRCLCNLAVWETFTRPGATRLQYPFRIGVGFVCFLLFSFGEKSTGPSLSREMLRFDYRRNSSAWTVDERGEEVPDKRWSREETHVFRTLRVSPLPAVGLRTFHPTLVSVRYLNRWTGGLVDGGDLSCRGGRGGVSITSYVSATGRPFRCTDGPGAVSRATLNYDPPTRCKDCSRCAQSLPTGKGEVYGKSGSVVGGTSLTLSWGLHSSAHTRRQSRVEDSSVDLIQIYRSYTDLRLDS